MLDVLQGPFEQALKDSAVRVFAGILSEKVAAQGLTLTERETDRLVKHLKSGATETLSFRRWRWWENANLDIEWTEEDSAIADERLQRLLGDYRLSQIVNETIEQSSLDILATLRRGWRAESRRQGRERSGFEKRLDQRWGNALSSLGMVLTIAREAGAAAANCAAADPEFESRVLLDVLTRLHARACQITGEIISLLAAGFADGAMARWRTLHEVAVISFFLASVGEAAAERYADHQIVESYRAATDYRECSNRLGYDPMSDYEFEAICSGYRAALLRYGDSFGAQYGWAADFLNGRRPTFREIERFVGIDHMRAHYRLASHNVHANPKGVFFRLGLIRESDLLLAGPSNAGLADPGDSAAISLLQTSVALMNLRPTIDSLVSLKILSRLANEVGASFQKAHDALEGDG